MTRFNLKEYLASYQPEAKPAAEDDFYKLCEEVKQLFYADWENQETSRTNLEIQKKAIIGYSKEKLYFMERISEILRSIGSEHASFPDWYSDLTEAVYHENWGLAGLAQWFSPQHAQSSSAKIIGDRIFFLENGHMVLKPQRISPVRLAQLIKAFLLLTPEERMDRNYHEVYLLDGTRVTIFAEPMAKKGQAAVIFRRYIVPSLSFEEQAKRGTIPAQAIPFFQHMVKVGYNIAFLGAVRTAKTTFLSTWQSYEDPTLEGVMVETDPEIPMNQLLPDAPVLQLIADGDQLKSISKNLLRSDADYFILAEARDGIALDTAIRIASKGTKRMKITFHSRLPSQFPLEAATEIVKATGGDLHLTMQKIACSFDYLFHFIQLKDKGKKRLKGIWQMFLDEKGDIHIDPLCRYDPVRDGWEFENFCGPVQTEYGLESDSAAFLCMMQELEKLNKYGFIKSEEKQAGEQ